MTARRFLAIAAPLVASLVACSGAPAPIYSGSLTGHAGYKNGSGGANIAISLTGAGTSSTLTDSAGNWAISGLRSGAYSITAVAPSALEPLLVESAQVGTGPTTAPAFSFTGIGAASGNISLGAATGNAGIVAILSTTGQSAVTDDAGDWSIASIPAGNYTLVAARPGRSSSVSTTLAISIGATTQAPDLLLPAAAALPGAISGSVGITGVSPQSGIAISAQGPVSGAALTRADGSFLISGLPDGQYTVSAQVRSTQEATITASATIASGISAPVAFQFSPVGSVRGVATRADGASDNSGIAITSAGSVAVTLTDALGRYQLNNVAAGTATVQASLAGGGTSAVDVAVVWDTQVVAPDLNLAAIAGPPGEIRGTATFSNLSDASGVSITLSGPTPGSQVTSTDGTFDFPGLQAGSYLVTAQASSTVEGTLSTPITVTNLLVPGVDFQLMPTASIQGAITENGQPAGSALIFVNGTTAATESAADGSYLLASVPAGVTLALQASARGLLSPLVQIAPLSRGELATAPLLNLSDPSGIGTIAGGVQLVTGLPAVGAPLVASGPGLLTLQATTAADGSYSFPASEGVYSLAISAADGSSETIPGVTVFPGALAALYGSSSTGLPLGTVQLQQGQRAIAAPMSFFLNLPRDATDPVIRASSDALILTNYAQTEGGDRGSLWLVSGGNAVKMPAPFVYNNVDSYGADTQLELPSAVLGPNHTALYVVAPYQSTAGTIYVGHTDGTATAGANNAYAYQRIASGGSTVAYVGWDENENFQIFSFNVDDPSTVTQDTASPEQLVNPQETQTNPAYVSPDGAYIWYWAYLNGTPTISVVPSTGCNGASNCPERIPFAYQDWELFPLALSADQSSVLMYSASGPIAFIASMDGSQVLQLGQLNYFGEANSFQVLPAANGASDVLYLTTGGALNLVALDPTATPINLINNVNYSSPYPIQYAAVGDTLVVGALANDQVGRLTTLVTIPLSLASGPTKLTGDSTGFALLPSRRVAYDLPDGNGNHPLVSSNLDGSSISMIDPGPLAACCAVDAAGDRLAWLATDGDGNATVVAGTPQGGTPATLAITGALGSNPSVQITPDGKTIAALVGDGMPIVLYQPDSSSSGETQSLNQTDYYVPYTEQLLADGTIAFVGYKSGQSGTPIIAASLSGGALTENLWNENAFGGRVCAPDNSGCVFYMYPSSSNSSYALDLLYAGAGAQLSQIGVDVPWQNRVQYAGSAYLGIDVSPDGNTLLFRNHATYSGFEAGGQLLDLGTATTFRFDGMQEQPLLGGSSAATWMPDGTAAAIRLGTVAPYGFQDGLYRYASAGSQEVRR